MNYKETAQYLTRRIGEAGKEIPQAVVVLGSGLGKLGDMIADPLVIPYSYIPNFMTSTAVGHKGNLIVGTLGGRTVMAMQGRFHYYEGYTMQQVTFPMRVFSLMGIGTLLVSNAAGAVNPAYRVGDLMVITDHINFMPNPLIGPNKEEFGPRFPDMTDVYSLRLRSIADRCASDLGITLQHGVYVAGTGPTYETPAEYRMYRVLGGDACGMSTVPEVIVARHCDMEIFGMSVITNQANDLKDGTVNDADDVVLQADRAADLMTALFSKIIEQINRP
jgi:purine-nucleoside phosphorylase